MPSLKKRWREFLAANPLFRYDVIDASPSTSNPHGIAHRRVFGVKYDGTGTVEHYFVTWQAHKGDEDYRDKTNFFDYRQFKSRHAAEHYFRTGKRIDR
jgi:hypothetical protein